MAGTGRPFANAARNGERVPASWKPRLKRCGGSRAKRLRDGKRLRRRSGGIGVDVARLRDGLLDEGFDRDSCEAEYVCAIIRDFLVYDSPILLYSHTDTAIF